MKGSPFVRHLIECPRDPYTGGADFLPLREIDDRIDPAENEPYRMLLASILAEAIKEYLPQEGRRGRPARKH